MLTMSYSTVYKPISYDKNLEDLQQDMNFIIQWTFKRSWSEAELSQDQYSTYPSVQAPMSLSFHMH